MRKWEIPYAFGCKELDSLALHRISEYESLALTINDLIRKAIKFQFDAISEVCEAQPRSDIGDSSLNLKAPIPCNQQPKDK